KVIVNAWTAVVATPGGERGVHQHLESSILLDARRLGAGLRRVEAARRDAEPPTELANGNVGPLRGDRRKGYRWSVPKRAETFFSRSRSRRSSRTSFRRRVSSSRSSLISPVRPLVRSARVRSTQSRSADSVRSSSRAAAPTVLPSSSTSRTAPSLNSSENCRRGRRPALLRDMRDIVSTFRNVSTKSDQPQRPVNPLHVIDQRVVY